MKKALLLITALTSTTFLSSFERSEDYVYICKGPKSERYHLKEDCRGLNNCSTDTYKVTLTEAKKLKRTLCGFED